MPFIQGGDFTHKSQEAMMGAQNIAREENQQQIDALHLLFSLLSQEESIVLTLLGNLQVDIEDLKRKTKKAIAQIPFLPGAQNIGQFYLTQDLAQVLEKAREEAMKMGDEFISIEHLFLGLLIVKTRAQDILKNVRFLSSALKESLDRETILRQLAEIRGGEKIRDPEPESKYEVVRTRT